MSQTVAALDRLLKSPEYQQLLRDAKAREAETHRKLQEIWNNLSPAEPQSPTTPPCDGANVEGAGISCHYPNCSCEDMMFGDICPVVLEAACKHPDPEAHMCAYPGCDCVGVHCKASR